MMIQHKLKGSWSLHECSTYTQFLNLESTWNRVTEGNAIYKPFISFDWFRLWLKHFLGEHRLLILVLHEGDRPVAILPALRKEENLKGISVSKIELAGNVYSPIQTLLSCSDDIHVRQKHIQCFMEYFTSIDKAWDILSLEALPDEDRTFRIIMSAVIASGYRFEKYFCFGNWYLDNIDYTSKKYFTERSKNLKSGLKKSCRKATELGNVRFTMLTTPEQIQEGLKSYFHVYERSWKKREVVGPDFYFSLLPFAAQKNMLRLGTLSLGDEPIAAGFALLDEGCAYFEKTAYDERYKSIGAGSIWMSEMIKHVLDCDRVRTIDFLRGDDEYKSRWVGKRRERNGITIFNYNIKGHLLTLLHRHILPVVRNEPHLAKLKAALTTNILKYRYLMI